MEEEECLKCEGDCLYRLSLLETVRGWNSFSLETLPLSRNSWKFRFGWSTDILSHCTLFIGDSHLAESKRTCERHLYINLCIYTWRGLKIIIKSRVARYWWRLMFWLFFLNIALKMWVHQVSVQHTWINSSKYLKCAGYHALLHHSVNDHHIFYI